LSGEVSGMPFDKSFLPNPCSGLNRTPQQVGLRFNDAKGCAPNVITRAEYGPFGQCQCEDGGTRGTLAG
jgi:hypothetical protein